MTLPRKWIQKYLSARTVLTGIGYHGDYKTWEKAEEKSTGYGNQEILNKIVSASRQVRDGKASFERDGVLFYDSEPEFPLLAALQHAILEANGHLRVVDFGGGLGSHYFRIKPYLPQGILEWAVIEQPHIVEIGKQEFETDKLRFYDKLGAPGTFEGTTLFHFGCVLPYLKEPYQVLGSILKNKGDYVLIDKHPLIKRAADRLTVQVVPSSIYKASYPAWFFSEDSFRLFMRQQACIFEYSCSEIVNIDAVFKGFFHRIS